MGKLQLPPVTGQQNPGLPLFLSGISGGKASLQVPDVTCSSNMKPGIPTLGHKQQNYGVLPNFSPSFASTALRLPGFYCVPAWHSSLGGISLQDSDTQSISRLSWTEHA